MTFYCLVVILDVFGSRVRTSAVVSWSRSFLCRPAQGDLERLRAPQERADAAEQKGVATAAEVKSNKESTQGVFLLRAPLLTKLLFAYRINAYAGLKAKRPLC